MIQKPSAPGDGPEELAAPAAQPARNAATSAKREGGATDAVTGLLGAGFQALKGVHDDIRERRSRVFAALLGVEPNQPEAGSSPPNDAAVAGPRHFDNVFDQRVAESLQRLGYPPPEVFAALVELLGALPKAQGPGESAATPKAAVASQKASTRSRSPRTTTVDPKN
jgi:hypothetical protein